jgi:spore coat protein U-like protein
MLSSMNKYISLAAVAAAALALGVSGANAHTTVTDNLTVSADVVNACTVDASTPLNFGPVMAGDPAKDGSTTISVTCGTGVAYTVGMGDGQHMNSGTRRVAHGTDYINYSISAVSSGGANWDNTNPNAVGNTGDGTAQPFPVYGQLAAVVAQPAGHYSDTVAVSVYY